MNLSVYTKRTNALKRQTRGKEERLVEGKTDEWKK
jgi:hypothetical protein